MPFQIIEIAAVKVDKNLNIIDEYSRLIKPKINKKLHSKIRTILNY
ncbi:exonuclease domain-containing protein, partial [Coprococcus eutactus]|nr:exonuclease domain-containing protein [Coprococcus eutactus]